MTFVQITTDEYNKLVKATERGSEYFKKGWEEADRLKKLNDSLNDRMVLLQKKLRPNLIERLLKLFKHEPLLIEPEDANRYGSNPIYRITDGDSLFFFDSNGKLIGIDQIFSCCGHKVEGDGINTLKCIYLQYILIDVKDRAEMIEKINFNG